MRGLYPVVDVDALTARGFGVIEFAERVLAARPPYLQLRAKSLSARSTLVLLRRLAPLCTAAGTLLFANDRPDLALLAGCAGVHLGQDDLPVAAARELGGGLKLGLSTHDLDQLERGLADRPDYVAFGPVFPTRSKQRPDPTVGLDLLARAAERAARDRRPLVAIGGITLARAPELARLGVMAAVIADLIPESGRLQDVAGRAIALHAALGGA